MFRALLCPSSGAPSNCLCSLWLPYDCRVGRGHVQPGWLFYCPLTFRKRISHAVRASVSFFNFQYSPFSLKSSNITSSQVKINFYAYFNKLFGDHRVIAGVLVIELLCLFKNSETLLTIQQKASSFQA
jgi:hypothetical protein